ncbi:hypothetical protein BDZ45DRAFT_310542 [Acephala macrosclerotiorum]|nr:hypothetical protein BDZ45DRAFT_310542 [Acephala macrosclerotiorum]
MIIRSTPSFQLNITNSHNANVPYPSQTSPVAGSREAGPRSRGLGPQACDVQQNSGFECRSRMVRALKNFAPCRHLSRSLMFMLSWFLCGSLEIVLLGTSSSGSAFNT